LKEPRERLVTNNMIEKNWGETLETIIGFE
jgi:hypothetical protein